MCVRSFRRPSAGLVLLTTAALALAGRAAIEPLVQAQANPIVQENAQSGSPSSEWDVSGAGDPSIQGFATDISVNKGDTVSFKVKTDSSNYRIDIYRLGYYGGAGARLVAADLVPSAVLPQAQPACVVDAVTGLADCGNWGVSASWSTAGAVSGIYVAKLKRIDVGGASQIVFVVRDDARQAEVVVQTSDTTWQAYNRYGGGSLYCAESNLGTSNVGTVYANSCARRATKVSYNRPFDTREHDATSFVFNAEYPMVRFLEANGYDVKYISGVDTERRAADLVGAKKPKAFFSVGHDEYWSAGQRASVEAARNAGVSLAFFSGNEMYWKTRFESSVAGTPTPYRTLVGYKDTLGGVKLDQVPGVSTGTWRDTRFAPPVADSGRPENTLTGTIWTVNSGTSAITVPASMASLRFWRNTSVAGLTSGSATLGVDTLGYEWDEDLDNGARPDGLMHLSATTVSGVEKILDFGETVGTGTATHNLTLYRHSSGALVFGAGTVQWAWGLDGNHDRGSAPPSLPMQQATMNLLADMGVQPGTAQNGLVASSASSDVSAPTSVVTSPAGGATVGSGDRVNITGTASDSGGGVVAGVEVSVNGGASWHSAQGTTSWTYEWAPGAPGNVTIRTRAVDDSGNRETPGAGSGVSVVPSSCPCPSLWSASTVPSIVDAGDPNAVELGLKFRSDVNGFIKGVRFYKSADNSGTHVGSLWTSTGTQLATATFSAESASGWQEVLFNGAIPVTANTTYVVSYHANGGHYSATGAYFTSQGIDRPPLHALPSGLAGGNGVFRYGPTAFPTETYNATNYWVDVVFDSTPDLLAPQITSVSATALDSTAAIVTWTTDEASTSRVDYSTSSAFAAAGIVSVSDAAFVTAHSVRLTGLTPTSAYYFRVRSTDHSGNEASMPSLPPAPVPGAPPAPSGPPPPSFTTPSPTLHDTMLADFSAGTSTGTYAGATGYYNNVTGLYVPATDGDGELTLAPALGTEFSGTAMPAGWSAVLWDQGAGGGAVVGGGTLTVDGARVATCVDVGGQCVDGYTITPGHSLEFVATFTGDPYQHSGFGLTLAGDVPFALFSTTAPLALSPDGVTPITGSLWARTRAGSADETYVNLGTTYFNRPNRFRIDWLASRVDYYINGGLVASHPVAIAGPMRPVAASDFKVMSGTIVVDWMRTTPYASAGYFLSRVFGGSTSIDWQNISWLASTPAGTSVGISVRTGTTSTPDGSWSAFAPISAPGSLGLQSNYIQYRAELATTDLNQTPVLADVVIRGAAVPPVQIITPAITWTAPASITYGTPLGPTQLNAATNVPPAAGTIVYTPASGTVLAAGEHALSVTFTPTDTTRYTSATATVPITVLKATPAVTWPTPAPIAYGTPLGATQLNATANVPGTFAYAPPSGTVLAAGAGQPLSAAFTPTNAANYNGATASVAITVVKTTGAVTVSSSNSQSLFGVPITLTATVVPVSATGSVTFKDGTTVLGAGAIAAGAASITTASLAVGAHSITAVYGGDGSVAGGTSAVLSQAISASAKVALTFSVHALQDTTKKPKVQSIPVPNATVKVFTTANACVGNIFKSLNPKKWGQIFDGPDGVGGVDGCPAMSVGTYEATGTTNAAGMVTIIVPPLALSLQNQYVAIARATNFDYVKTASSPDPLYSAYPILMAAANTTRDVPLSLLATFNGKIVPGAQTEFFGSYLNIIQPEYMDWTEDQEQYPFVMVARGGWELTTSVTPPEGFVPDEPALAASVADATTAVQFTMTDVGSEWTETTVNHSIVHNGAAMAAKTSIPMVDRKVTLARNDNRRVMHDSPATMLDVMVNDRVNHLRKPLKITAVTPALNGKVVLTDDGLNVSYAPVGGYAGVDTFTYTITDSVGGTSTATVSVNVLATPEVAIRNATAVEGNAGTTPATFNVVLSNPSLETVVVSYQTVDGTATAGADYVAASGTVTFPPGDTAEPITVQILGDTLAEPNEKFSVTVTGVKNATISAASDGVVTIADDDPPEISIAPTASAKEGDVGSTNVAVGVKLSQPHVESVWVNYATADGSALAGSDYVNTTGTLQFEPGTVTKTIFVPVLGDTVGERTESFYVDLSAPVNATLAGSRATVSIVNDDNSAQVFSTAAELGAGTLADGAYISDTSGGEIMLAPSQGAEFSGTSLPAGWTLEKRAAAGASAMVAKDVLMIDGAALLGPGLVGAGQTLEFAASFSAPDQNVGFGTSSALSSTMAMFIIKSDRQLYARTVNGAKTFETLMAGVDWLQKPHRYQIAWNAGNAQYSIDGTLMIAHTNVAWGAVTMRPVIIDGIAGDGGLAVDWIRATPYAGAGTYTSPVFDAGDTVLWQKLTTTNAVPAGTTSTITYRTGTTPVPDATWTPFTVLGTNGGLAGSSRYAQFSIQMTTSAPAKTPVTQDVTVQYKK